MGISFATHVSPKVPVPQSQPLPGRESEMGTNAHGGVVFKIPCFDALQRFLILGSESNTVHYSEKEQTKFSFNGIVDCLTEDFDRTLGTIVEVSVSGRAPSNDPALFALACVLHLAEPHQRQAVRYALPQVARIGTHILHFAHFVNQLKGWGSGTRKVFQHWYNTRSAGDVAFQVTKYAQRDGWTHRDVFRLAHPKAPDTHGEVYKYIARPKTELTEEEWNAAPPLLSIVENVKALNAEIPDERKAMVRLITDHRLAFEVLPSEALSYADVWHALFPHMGLTALLRNLNRLTALGVLNGEQELNSVVTRFTSSLRLQEARLHPLQLLKAVKVYRRGRGIKGSLVWTPNEQVGEALDRGLEISFGLVEPTGKRMLIAVDVSGSMNSAFDKEGVLTSSEAAICMALVALKVETGARIMAFQDKFVPLHLTPDMSFSTALRKSLGLSYGRTDCSLPMTHSQQHRWDVDMFQVYTDNETWAGHIHPSKALEAYRVSMNKPQAKLAVVATENSQFSIADPQDPGMMDFVGFDTATPKLISEFARF